MLRDGENPKDTSDSNSGLDIAIKDRLPFIAYIKTNKLITALYIVTDILDKDEPLRMKLRDLGTGIISDVNSNPIQAIKKISEVVSFLDIASAVKMISEMNCNILKKEFLELSKSIKEYTKHGDPSWLETFMIQGIEHAIEGEKNITHHPLSVYQGQSTRIGVQKGSTLMNALSRVEVSDKAFERTVIKRVSPRTVLKSDFDILKKQRREIIFKIIKSKPDGMSIKDIVLALRSLGEAWGEKTLQRELISMVKDNVLNKSGEKRWSKYFLPARNA